MIKIGDSGMCEQKILTIAIPTYNRSKYLDVSLSRITEQINGLSEKIELIVSDNCSSDNTEEVVTKYIERGLDVRYIRNKENLGMDGNFVQCFRMAQSKYVWVLGDDDYLLPNSLDRIVNMLIGNDCGLVHLKIGGDNKSNFTVHNNPVVMYSEISYWITYISSNIVNTKYVSQIQFEKYIGTYFTLIPLYLTALFSHSKNIMVNFRAFNDGAAVDTNGGYNFFEVFCNNYLSIIYQFVRKKKISRWRYELEKYNLFRRFLLPNYYQLYFIRKGKHRYETKSAFKYMLDKYWYEPYFYASWLTLVLKIVGNVKIKNA
jgi:glycosyltransferase involved in cell wall biosynthesis